MIVLRIQRTRLTIAIARVESLCILLFILAAYGIKSGFKFYYNNYGIILDVMTAIEVFILIRGAPWDGIRRIVIQLWRPSDRTYHAGYSLVRADAVSYRARREQNVRCR